MAREFEFSLGQRVIVPGYKEAQAVVVNAVADVLKGNSYVLRYLALNGNAVELTTSEAELMHVNEPTFTDYRAIKFPSGSMTSQARADWLRDQAAKLRDAAKPWDRAARLDGKTKSKKKKK